MKTWQRLRRQPELLSQYLVREQVIDEIRTFFKQEEFHEVETPLLVQRPSSETYLEFFATTLKTAEGQSLPAYLTTSPEYSMKKLLVAGLPKIFQLCKSFRNREGKSGRHNPEFLILEWYRTHADYTDIMADCEHLFAHLVKKIRKSKTFTYQGKKYDLSTPWPKISVAEAFAKYAQVEIDELVDESALIKRARAKGYQVTPQTTWEEAYNQIMLNEVEPRLAEFKQPLFLYDYPVSQAALSRRKSSDPRFAERFEWYLGGIELGNAFSELTDAAEQETRLRQDLVIRREQGLSQQEMDEDFIVALKAGMPEAGGIAVGVDRLIMLLADVESIHQTQFFPVDDVFDLD